MQSGDTSKGLEESGTFLTFTRKHQITWNQRRQYLPFLDAFTFGRIEHQRPTYQSYNVLEILITHQEVYSCTRTHQNTQNQPRPELPFLESKAINSQQFFSHQTWNDFVHYFSNRDVPKKLAYSLKSSRYKAIIPALKSSHWNPKTLQQPFFFPFS
ncbi:hypothetical protein DY000_02036752 [Brassica cretica]|uniref:Uncharacterized protein n=1 Tax=Brassica cretica TaxID=69181 RepID=A0ABQ7BLB1_BRACR|nr:hypothetical protein DY000_02036752 [Brassica cretica]